MAVRIGTARLTSKTPGIRSPLLTRRYAHAVMVEYVVGEQRALMIGGPGQKSFVIETCQASVLGANYVDTRISSA